MSALQTTVIPGLLNLMRKRRSVRDAAETQIDCETAPSAARLREAELEDFESVAQLKRRFGMNADTRENWDRLWTRNPALANQRQHVPIGWILESEGRPVGYLGNIPLLYRFGDCQLTAVTGHGLAVEPAYRSLSMSLVAAFYRQKWVDLYLTTTAVESVGKIARAFKSVPIPQPDYADVLFWVLRPYAFANAVMKNLELNSTFSHLGAALGSAAIASDKYLRHRQPRRTSKILDVSETTVSAIGDDFEQLWMEKLKEGKRLLADRSSDLLRWHFDIPGDPGSVRILCCRQGKELLGYAVLRILPVNSKGVRRALVADMLAKADDSLVLRELWAAAYECAKNSDSDVLEMIGFPSVIRNLCRGWNPYVRKYPACPFYYKAADPGLHAALADSSAWYATPFDGDTSLMP